jgi:uncharacterized membrane protein YfhO
VTYERPGTDEIVVRVRSSEAGIVRVLESFDPGWRAEIEGKPAEVLAADDTFLGVALPAGGSGERVVRFTYHTPGVIPGAFVSLASLILLAVMVFRSRRHNPELELVV